MAAKGDPARRSASISIRVSALSHEEVNSFSADAILCALAIFYFITVAWYMSFLKQNGFNAIRFLFNHETILTDQTLEPPNTAKYGKNAAWEAPELTQYKYIDMFLKLAEV